MIFLFNDVCITSNLQHLLIKKDKTIIIYTKGDANNDIDGWKVTPDMIIGIVKKKVPAIGFPTIWLNERW